MHKFFPAVDMNDLSPALGAGLSGLDLQADLATLADRGFHGLLYQSIGLRFAIGIHRSFSSIVQIRQHCTIIRKKQTAPRRVAWRGREGRPGLLRAVNMSYFSVPKR